MSRTRMTALPFLLFLALLSPFVIFDSDNPLISRLLCKSKTLWNSFMILGRNVEQNQTTSGTRMTTLPFLLFVLSPLVMSESDYPLISMVLGRNVEQDQTTCRVQE